MYHQCLDQCITVKSNNKAFTIIQYFRRLSNGYREMCFAGDFLGRCIGSEVFSLEGARRNRKLPFYLVRFTYAPNNSFVIPT